MSSARQPAVRPVGDRSARPQQTQPLPPPRMHADSQSDDDATSVMMRPSDYKRPAVTNLVDSDDRDAMEGTMVMSEAPNRAPPVRFPPPAAGSRPPGRYSSAPPNAQMNRPAAGNRPSVPPIEELVESPSYRTGVPRTGARPAGTFPGVGGHQPQQPPTQHHRSRSQGNRREDEAAALMARAPQVAHRMGQPKAPPAPVTQPLPSPDATAFMARAPSAPPNAMRPLSAPPPGQHWQGSQPPQAYGQQGRQPSARPQAQTRSPSLRPQHPTNPPRPMMPVEAVQAPSMMGMVMFAGPLVLATLVVAALALL